MNDVGNTDISNFDFTNCLSTLRKLIWFISRVFAELTGFRYCAKHKSCNNSVLWKFVINFVDR
jgi:hypothetical protein